MITNILLGLILGVVITSFIILNEKINKIDGYIRETLSNTNVINTGIGVNHKIISIILDRFNDKVLKDNEHYDNIITLLKSIYICNEIKKQAKISSKINSKTKTSKSINK